MRRLPSLLLLVLAAIACRDARVKSALPGAPPVPVETARRLREALAARGPAYQPHTRHRDGDQPSYTNRLILESSPYLLLHAHNPVDWYPWGEEAFAAARASGKPIFLSIGYATCHWCHVMEEESFEDPEVAAALNRDYVCIKVDREERPDVDATFLAVVESLSGSGGWPMSVWLTPTGEPFFGGTYFPARDGDRGPGSRGLLGLAGELARRYHADPAGVARSARAIVDAVNAAQAHSPTANAAALDDAPVRLAIGSVAQGFDRAHGGTLGAPKFPSNTPLRLLLAWHQRTGDAPSLEIARATLAGMAHGGIHDQLGGGFHRYSVDARWEVPHFEKMLYDNAKLARAYTEAYVATGDSDDARVAADTLDFLLRDLASPDGAFYAALDADSPGGEGHAYTWTRAELDAALGADEGARFARYYGVSERGPSDGRSVLHVIAPDPVEEAALAADRAKLFAIRRTRPQPPRDEDVFASWNGLAIGALARAGGALGDARYTEAARRAARFVLERLRPPGGDGAHLRRCWRAGTTCGEAYLDDHAAMIAGLLDLYQATFELEWLRAAIDLATEMDALYADPAGGWWQTRAPLDARFARLRPGADGPEPSGAALALDDVLRLAALTDDARWRKDADRALAAIADELRARPLAHTDALFALLRALTPPRDIVLVAPPDGAGLAALASVVDTSELPFATVVAARQGPALDALAAIAPLARDRPTREGHATAYVCENRVCKLPTTDPAALAARLRRQLPP